MGVRNDGIEIVSHQDAPLLVSRPQERRLHFINVHEKWEAVRQRYHEWIRDANPRGQLIPRDVFGRLIGIEDESFAVKVFDTLARRARIQDLTITIDQLREFWEHLTYEEYDGRLFLFFQMLDKDADGRITEQELEEFIHSCASAFKLSEIQEQAEECAALLMEELDFDRTGYMEVSKFELLILMWSSAVSKLPKRVKTQQVNPLKRRVNKLQDHWKRIWVISLWLTICAALFTWKFIQYKRHYVFRVMGYCVCFAKGGAETVKFNMALILLPVCRNTITWLRSHTNFGKIIPFNDEIKFHQVVAVGAGVGIGLHTIAHAACNFPRLLHASKQAYAPLAEYFGEQKPPNYWWFVKGIEGWTGIVMVVLMVIAYTLAQPWLRLNNLKNVLPLLKSLTGIKAFWYSHLLFVFVYALLIVHGNYLYLQHQWYHKTTWMYIGVPMVVYGCERLIRIFRANHMMPARILKIGLYPGGERKILGLFLSKPDGFNYTSGQYIFVKCHHVPPFEWHPFSLTSAPGDDYISVHIQANGDWTSDLIQHFTQELERPFHGSHFTHTRLPDLKIDGPYGAPAQDYNKYEVLLLVGVGIGATPMISIMKDIASGQNGVGRVKKAYFYWSTDEHSSFEILRAEMNKAIELDNGAGVIEIHNYYTSVKEADEARATFITALQNLHYDRNGVDLDSRTRVRAHFARPDWPAVLHRIAANHKDQQVGVFYCGRPDVGRELSHLLAQESYTATSTRFEFHKQNF